MELDPVVPATLIALSQGRQWRALDQSEANLNSIYQEPRQ